MSLKLKSLSALLALVFAMSTGNWIRAQSVRVVAPDDPKPTLGCCKCLGGSNTLDLSTIPSNHWTVNGSNTVLVTTVNPYWNINPGPANWLSTVANTATTNIAGGTYEYRLPFEVSRCTIEQRVTLSGNYGGDDDVYVYLDIANSAHLISQCTGGWCFNTPHKTLSTFANYAVPLGPHTLIVQVKNALGGASPSGMFINAKLTGTCVK
jgi:hypothetical protein